MWSKISFRGCSYSFGVEEGWILIQQIACLCIDLQILVWVWLVLLSGRMSFVFFIFRSRLLSCHSCCLFSYTCVFLTWLIIFVLLSRILFQLSILVNWTLENTQCFIVTCISEVLKFSLRYPIQTSNKYGINICIILCACFHSYWLDCIIFFEFFCVCIIRNGLISNT